MRYAILLSLAAGGLLMASNPHHISGNERMALETSSPRVHLASSRHHKTSKSGRVDRVESDKTTIEAFVPVGK